MVPADCQVEFLEGLQNWLVPPTFVYHLLTRGVLTEIGLMGLGSPTMHSTMGRVLNPAQTASARFSILFKWWTSTGAAVGAQVQELLF